MKFPIRSFAIIIFLFISSVAIEAQQKNSAPKTKQDMDWQQLAKGLELGTFLAPQPAEVGDSLVRVLRIDPKYYRFRLLNASAIENVKVTVENTSIQELRLTYCKLKLKVSISNPTTEYFSELSAEFDVFIASTYVGNGSFQTA